MCLDGGTERKGAEGGEEGRDHRKTNLRRSYKVKIRTFESGSYQTERQRVMNPLLHSQRKFWKVLPLEGGELLGNPRCRDQQRGG